VAASPLYTLHRLLISFAIALGVLLLVYGITRYVRAGDTTALGIGVFGAAASVALALYLRWFVRSRSR